jgi:cyclopropane fatty-acyl-phospholipid synthase-like methyltransferase
MDSVKASLVGSLRRSAPREPHHDELDTLIDRRAREARTEKEDADRIEESWKETTRIYNAEHREARRHQWIGYYRRLSESFRRRSEECAERAAALDPGEGRS